VNECGWGAGQPNPFDFRFALSRSSRHIQRRKADMLTTLRIKNLALVADLTLELQPGYNVITGETGAGKSILIGALNLVLGERADRTLIRSGGESCSVEAVFDITRIRASLAGVLEENGLEPCQDQQLVIKRAFTLAGVNRQFINGSPTTLAILAAIGELLVDIHGPHEHQSLLHPARQMAILDAFGGLAEERDNFAELVRRRAALEAELAELIVDERTYTQQLDLLRFQVNEITAAHLQSGEQEQVEQDHRRASNGARLLQLSQTARDFLAEGETSLLTQTALLGRTLQELERVDPSAEPMVALHEQAVLQLRELQAALSRYSDKVELDPAQLQRLEERLNLIQSLRRKYGATLEAVLSFGEEAARKLHSLEQRDVEVGRIKAELGNVEADLERTGRDLSAKRRKIIPRLAKAVSQQLADLGFNRSRFEITIGTQNNIEQAPAESRVTHHASRHMSHGFDTIEFQFAPNPGEPIRLLRAIASSGELARVMLALKTVLATEDQVPVLVFDEVDANVGGETANAVGEKMQQIARNRQVLCITHLPQVAAPASAHYVATKQVREGRTISEIKLLEQAERVTELARMLGGQSQAARKHAEAMLND
jgi:DNA repair protein RecN (Recombination protein N)